MGTQYYTCQIIALLIHCDEAMKIQKSLQWSDEFVIKKKTFFKLKLAKNWNFIQKLSKNWKILLSFEENPKDELLFSKKQDFFDQKFKK